MVYEFKFDQQKVQTILNALGELPLKQVINLFAEIQKSVIEQDERNAVPLSDLGFSEMPIDK